MYKEDEEEKGKEGNGKKMFHEFNFCGFVLPMFRQVFDTYSLIQCREIMFLLRELYACQHCVLLVMWMVSKIKTSMTRVIVHPKLLYLFKSCTHCAVLVTILRLQLSEKKTPALHLRK